MKDDRDRGSAGRQEDVPLPDRARRRRRHLQPAGRRPSSSSTADLAGIYPRQDHQVERPGDRRDQRGRRPCPTTAILVVHRSDGSGTTNAFTTYLDTVEPGLAFERSARARRSSGRRAIGAPGNDGVAGGVKQTTRRDRLRRAQRTRPRPSLTSACVKNADGNFVPGSTDGVTAAAEAAVDKFPADFRAGPDHQRRRRRRPTRSPSYTYLLVYADQTDATKGQALVAFIHWALTDGQAAEAPLGYAPLPGRSTSRRSRSSTW